MYVQIGFFSFNFHLVFEFLFSVEGFGLLESNEFVLFKPVDFPCESDLLELNLLVCPYFLLKSSPIFANVLATLFDDDDDVDDNDEIGIVAVDF